MKRVKIDYRLVRLNALSLSKILDSRSLSPEIQPLGKSTGYGDGDIRIDKNFRKYYKKNPTHELLYALETQYYTQAIKHAHQSVLKSLFIADCPVYSIELICM